MESKVFLLCFYYFPTVFLILSDSTVFMFLPPQVVSPPDLHVP